MIDLVAYRSEGGSLVVSSVVVTSVLGVRRATLSAPAGSVLWAYPRGTRMGGIELDTRSSYFWQSGDVQALAIVGRRRSIRWIKRELRRLRAGGES